MVSDLKFVGSFNIEIVSEIQQLSPTGTTFITTSRPITFTLSVQPCEVQTFGEVTAPIGPIMYALGQPGLNAGPYRFEQSPACEYAMSETVLGLPLGPFVTFDKLNRMFTIVKSSDPSLVGVYNVTVISTFQQPKLDGSSKPVSAEIQFQISVYPCNVQDYR